jgi:epoxyqueuosine reductase
VARRAGLGFVGKNTMLINRRLGSWLFLAALLTDLELPPDPAEPGDCGQCRLCLEACPTGAFPEPYVLDARRCISYWTIEAASGHPAELAAHFGDWVFGCDVCQEVCPYNHRPLATGGASRFAGSRSAGPWTDADFLANADERAFRARYRRSPLNRPGRQGMNRNALTVLANARRGRR